MNATLDETTARLRSKVTARLRQGLAVETVRERDGWHVTASARAEHYERPEASMPHAARNAPRQVLLTRAQAAVILGIGKRAVHRLAVAGRLGAVRGSHGHRRYPADAVRARLIESLKPIPTPLTSHSIVEGEYEAYQIEHIAHRPGGDLDVVVSATPYDHRPRAYLAFRRAGVWRPLAGRDNDLASAIHRAEHEGRYAGWDSPDLVALLNTLEGS
ncbi:helix-turn-helix domain-containing protein [Nonomuraea sp. NPDC049750]|uniref:helix-turn-helix domain-containing protein n=1 Tax=Nonomuraea sp. NPDC049750 TaxID=3154738 RepID=UPI0034092D81